MANRIMSFRSVHYPGNQSPFMIRQEYTLRYYGILLFVVMIAVLLRLQYNQEVLIFGSVAAVVAFVLGNVMGKVALRRSIAEIFFINDGFSVICVDDILSKRPQKSFPIRFASPVRLKDGIQLSFEDQVIILKQQDWGGDFEVIWDWLNAGNQAYNTNMQEPENESMETDNMDTGPDKEAPAQ